MSLFVLISYDIPNTKRRTKLAKLLLDYGGERVQYSVFECYITPRNLDRLQERLLRLHEPAEDSIRIYFLCQNCRPRMLLLGVAQATDEPGLRII